MVSVTYFQTLFAYHHALYERVWESINHLTETQFKQDVNYSHGSVHKQMLHVTAVDKRWLLGLQGNPQARQFTLVPEDYPDDKVTQAIWQTTAEEVRVYLKTLTDEDLQHTPRGMGGPVWQVLAHMVNHGTDHRAQILRLLHDFGAPTFDQDMILHLWH